MPSFGRIARSIRSSGCARCWGYRPSGYYAWLDRPESHRCKENRQLTMKIRQFHLASRQRYGSPRIYQDLRDAGGYCSENRVARLMRQHDIQAKMARRFMVTTNSKNTLDPAPDLLRQQFRISGANRGWVSDTTAIVIRQGWLYLAVVLDLYSRQVIGWSMGERNNAVLVGDALRMALWRCGKVKGVIVHSDQGSTYASRDYHTRDQARESIFEYIEIFYNRKRRHSFLNYMTPVNYEKKQVSHF